jgi:predicted SnoaL-like aldol condensation-catalyzing enzyme
MATKPSIVFAHGLWADGSCFSKLIPTLQAEGHECIAAWIAADIVRIENDRLAEHWDVLQDEATKAESKSGLPTFGDRFTA